MQKFFSWEKKSQYSSYLETNLEILAITYCFLTYMPKTLQLYTLHYTLGVKTFALTKPITWHMQGGEKPTFWTVELYAPLAQALIKQNFCLAFNPFYYPMKTCIQSARTVLFHRCISTKFSYSIFMILLHKVY